MLENMMSGKTADGNRRRYMSTPVFDRFIIETLDEGEDNDPYRSLVATWDNSKLLRMIRDLSYRIEKPVADEESLFYYRRQNVCLSEAMRRMSNTQ